MRMHIFRNADLPLAWPKVPGTSQLPHNINQDPMMIVWRAGHLRSGGAVLSEFEASFCLDVDSPLCLTLSGFCPVLLLLSGQFNLFLVASVLFMQ